MRSARIAAALALIIMFAGPRANAQPAANLYLFWNSSADGCTHANFHYAGTSASDHVTIGGVDDAAAQPLAGSPCSAATAVAESTTAMSVGADCSPHPRTTTRVGYCSADVFDNGTIALGDGKDSVVVRRAPVLRMAIYLGSGNDSAQTVNGQPDYISCGWGYDKVVVDTLDFVDGDCEEITVVQVPG